MNSNNSIEMSVPLTIQEVKPLKYEEALKNLSEDERKEIIDLAKAINVTEIEKVMLYGSNVLRETFEQCGNFLKDESGSTADQEVIEQVRDLSQRASKSYEDFNLQLQSPNIFEKIALKILSKIKGETNRTEKLKNSAITSYKFLAELKASCDSWLEMLKKANGEIEYFLIADSDNIEILEKYIMAGQIAEERISNEIQVKQSEYEKTGLQKYSKELRKMQEGNEIFLSVLKNLEKSRDMYYLSIGQLILSGKANRNLQICLHTQAENLMTLISQQLRNSVLNAKTQEVLDGQKAIARLNDELIKEVSKNVGVTAEDATKLIYSGFYNVEAAKEAISTVIASCNEIGNIATEMLPKLKADNKELEGLIEDLKPCIDLTVDTTLKSENPQSNDSGELKF